MRRPDDSLSVSAVVVNFRARDHVLACVQALEAEGVDDIVVVDNDSRDGTGAALASAFPGVRFVPLAENLGYGGGVNRGAAVAKGDVILVCNPDTRPRPGAVAALVARLAAEEDLGIVGPRLENPDGSRYPSARNFPSLVDAMGHGFLGLVTQDNPFSRRYLLAQRDAEAAGRVDWVSGAWFAARKAAWDRVGGFDEGYFMFMEDVDLCWRAGRAGWGVAYEPAATVVHEVGVSRRTRPLRMLVAHHRSLLRFAARTSTGRDRLLLPAVAAGLGLRLAITLVAEILRTRVLRRRMPRSPA